mmetsp:Transcript_12882/g.30915  ORF Transcript_12882/g.30915 Transcript_12882/m.30915 type:complete len:235 (-) Transcript_12882:1200-1904(-)
MEFRMPWCCTCTARLLCREEALSRVCPDSRSSGHACGLRVLAVLLLQRALQVTDQCGLDRVLHLGHLEVALELLAPGERVRVLLAQLLDTRFRCGRLQGGLRGWSCGCRDKRLGPGRHPLPLCLQLCDLLILDRQLLLQPADLVVFQLQVLGLASVGGLLLALLHLLNCRLQSLDHSFLVVQLIDQLGDLSIGLSQRFLVELLGLALLLLDLFRLLPPGLHAELHGLKLLVDSA